MNTNTNKHTQKHTNINTRKHKHTYRLRKIKPSYRPEKIAN